MVPRQEDVDIERIVHGSLASGVRPVGISPVGLPATQLRSNPAVNRSTMAASTAITNPLGDRSTYPRPLPIGPCRGADRSRTVRLSTLYRRAPRVADSVRQLRSADHIPLGDRLILTRGLVGSALPRVSDLADRCGSGYPTRRPDRRPAPVRRGRHRRIRKRPVVQADGRRVRRWPRRAGRCVAAV